METSLPNGHAPLRSNWATQVVIGATNLPRTAAFLAVFGLQPTSLRPLSAHAAEALYGLNAPAQQLLLKPPDLDGAVRLVNIPADSGPMSMRPFENGLNGFDIYTRNLDLTRLIASAAGATASDPVSYRVGGKVRRESRIVSPTGDFAIFAVETQDRLPSVFDSQPERSHSDLTSWLWFVDEEVVDEEIAFWTGEAGMMPFQVIPNLDSRAMATLMSLPRPVKMGVHTFVDSAIRRRLELLYYTRDRVARRDNSQIRSGCHSIAFRVDDIQVAAQNLPSAVFGTPTWADVGHGDCQIVRAVSPGGIRFELIGPMA